MKLHKLDYLNLLLILLTIGMAIYFYPLLPAKVATHWNFAGEVDGWGSKNFQVFFLPLLIIGVYLLFQFLPKLDPKKTNYEQFATAYKIFQLVLIAFFVIIFLVTNLANTGVEIAVGAVVSSAIGLMFIIFGILMPKLKNNWFVGIRTPWTLSSDFVWQKTHQLGKYMFIVAGALFLFISYLPLPLVLPVFILLIILLLVPVVYSYFLFKKEQK